jgi:ribosomal protein S18 acetylase RimI-like enzyme
VSFPLDRTARLGLSLRPVRPDDMPFLSTLYATTRADELALTGWPEATKSLFVVHQFTAQNASYLNEFPDADRMIVERDGAAIGRVYVDCGGAVCRLIDITLMPAACGRGFGAALIEDLQAFAREFGKPVTLSVIASNPARRLYVRLGFLRSRRDGLYEQMIWRSDRR